MSNVKLTPIILGIIFLGIGTFLTFKPSLSPQKETIADLWAVFGIILMVLGVVLLLSPLIK